MITSWAMMLVLLVGGGNDLLDYLPAKHYWQAKSVTVTTENLLAELKADQKDKATAVRRLMAIRTLGEQKDPNALPALKKLLDSKELFEDEYARRAVAAIEGKESKPTGPTDKEMQSDLWLLPANCGVVVQARFQPGKPASSDDLVKTLGTMMPEGKAEETLAEVTKALISLAEKIGNVRLLGATIGVADNVGSKSGFVVVLFRGLYDKEAVRAALLEEKGKPEVFGDSEVLVMGRDTAMILPSKDQLVLLVGPARDQLPIGDMLNAVKTGKGKLTENEEMAKLVKSVDMSGPLWGAALIGQAYRVDTVINPFDTATLASKQNQDGLELTLTARGSDPNGVQQAVSEFNGHIAKAIQEVTREVERMPAQKPMAELLRSINAKVEGSKAVVTARLKGDPKAIVMWLFVARMGPREVPRKPEPDRPPPAP